MHSSDGTTDSTIFSRYDQSSPFQIDCRVFTRAPPIPTNLHYIKSPPKKQVQSARMHALHFGQLRMTPPSPDRMRSGGARGGKARLESNQPPQKALPCRALRRRARECTLCTWVHPMARKISPSSASRPVPFSAENGRSTALSGSKSVARMRARFGSISDFLSLSHLLATTTIGQPVE